MLMHGSEITTHIRHSCLMNEFDKFAAKERESLDSVYERLTTLVNIMNRNNVRSISVAINTKFLNCLQPEWSKYVTMVCHKQTGDAISYHELYDSEQILLAMKDEAGINLGNKEKDFMLDNSYGKELEELTAATMKSIVKRALFTSPVAAKSNDLGATFVVVKSRLSIAKTPTATNKDSGFELITYADADHDGCNDDWKSTSEGIQFLGEKMVSWSSKKQDCTTMSSTKAKYVSLSACFAQVIWMKTQLLDYGFHYNKIPIYCDSQSAIVVSCNRVQHSRKKHINIRYHFIKEYVEKGTIELYFVRTEYQLADQFIKALPKERVGYQGVVDKVSALYTKNLAKLWQDFMSNVFQKKEAIQYPRFIKLIIADLMMKFSNTPKRLEEDYHSIKDDVPL
nr:retrovirus-related Pol polyprotein from transposon TNT 1-94 [Tanacetum cinerariifolium]